MPLLTTTTKTNARIAELGQNIAAHLSAAATQCNRMVGETLQLGDADLTEWLQSRPPEETLQLLGAHGQLGETLNAAAAIATAILSESGLPSNIPTVDVRSAVEKLADQGRILDMQTLTVSTPPKPEPEPEPEQPQPEPLTED